MKTNILPPKSYYFPFTAIILSLTILIACQKEISNGKDHTVRIYLTDHQTPVFDSVFVDLQKLEVKLEDDSLSNGGWFELVIRPGIYNILRFRNGMDTLFATGTLPGNVLRKLRLTLGTQNSVMKDGISTPLRIDDHDRQVEVHLESGLFDITPAGQVVFWLDFDAGRSIQVDNSGPGSGNGYRLKSHIRIFSRSRSGSIEGKILPEAADPIIKAWILNDTVTAIPEREGEFRIVGLAAGTYQVLVDGNNGYRDTLLSNIPVRHGEDTHIPVITLRQ